MEEFAIALILQFTSPLIGAIVGALVARAQTSNRHRKTVKDETRELNKLIAQNTLMTCRIAIYDEHFSVNEKLEAYALYRKLGGNHQTKTYMDKLIGGDVDAYLDLHSIGR